MNHKNEVKVSLQVVSWYLQSWMKVLTNYGWFVIYGYRDMAQI